MIHLNAGQVCEAILGTLIARFRGRIRALIL